MPGDPTSEFARSFDSPSASYFAVTPNDTTDLANYARSLYVGGAGTVVVDSPAGDTTISFVGVAAGTILPICVKRVRATNTTATNIVALL